MSIDFIRVLLDTIACLIDLDRQVNLKTIEEAARTWFEEAEHQGNFSRATCTHALTVMQIPYFQRLLSFMTMGADPEGTWKRSINYQEWVLGAAIKKLVKHRFMAANPGNLVAVDFDLVNGYSVHGRAFPGVKPVEPMTLEDIRATLEPCSAAFKRACPDIAYIIDMLGRTIQTLPPKDSLVQNQTLIPHLGCPAAQAAKAAPAKTVEAAQTARSLTEGNIPLSHAEVMELTALAGAKATPAEPAAKATQTDAAVSWLKAVMTNLAAAPAPKTTPAATPVPPAKAGAGGGR